MAQCLIEAVQSGRKSAGEPPAFLDRRKPRLSRAAPNLKGGRQPRGVVLECGGTISAEHGVGIAKARWLDRGRGTGGGSGLAAARQAAAPLPPRANTLRT